jgi:Ca2+-binding RTX toxin-like protein
MGKRTGGVAALLIAVSALAQSSAASSPDSTSPLWTTTVLAETCFGQAPTIVGTPGEEVVGTEGPDVVVTNGALTASTLGGDDLLCVTAVAPDAADDDVVEMTCVFDTGTGHDRIDAAGGQLPCTPHIVPGLGRDEVLAARSASSASEPFAVSVDAFGETDHLNEGVADVDVISTGDEPDTVAAGLQDVVDLGGGDDSLGIRHEGASSGGFLDGGAGRNAVNYSLWTPFRRPNQHFHWRIDNQVGRLVRDGQVVAQLRGFADFNGHAKGPLKFIGSDLSETFDSVGLPPEEPLGTKQRWWQPLVVEMHGGDDVAVYHRGGSRSRFDGGDGTDGFSFAAGSSGDYPSINPDKAFLDLSTGTIRYNRANGRGVDTRALGFENVRWRSRADAIVRGTHGPNAIVARRGQPGREMVIYGRRGDDTLRGGAGDDALVGGVGNDVADGRGGNDRCSAELRAHCES